MYKAMGGVKSGNGNEKGIFKMPNEMVLVKISIQINYFKMYISKEIHACASNHFCAPI